ncbi:MAG: RodZ domain-containing protein [Candidatus Omnitrophota bacterium]
MIMEPIGEKLKKIRQEKGLSLEEAHKKTKIHVNILKAIEGDSLTDLSPVYLKGFLKIYCNFLGVDSRECAPVCREPAPADPKTILKTPEKGQSLKPPSFLENAGLKLNSLRPDKKIRKIIIAILIILAFGVILFKLAKFISLRPKVSPAVVRLKEERARAQAKVKSKTPVTKSQVVEVKLPKETSGGISLVIAAKENCLVLVKVDGRVVLHRVLEKGRSDSWKAKERVELSLGNASAVELIVNGERFANLGRRGQQLKNITITEKDGLRIPR